MKAKAPPTSEVTRISPGAAILVVALAIACYANSLGCGLVFDDLNAIVNNPAVRDHDAGAIVTTASWFGKPVTVYRPITTLSFALDHVLHGASPFGYHLVNVLLHAGVSLLVALLLVRVTASPSLGILAALLFATHPVHTEAVTSVVGRAEELSALFGLAAWVLLLGVNREGWRTAVAAALLLASALSKESGVTFFGAMAAAAALYPAGRGAPPLRAWRTWVALGSAALVAVAVRAVVIRGLPDHIDRLDNVAGAAPLGPRLLTAVGVLARYARVLVWPLGLAADRSYAQIPLIVSPAEPVFLAGVGVIVAGMALALWGWWHDRNVAFAVTLAAVTMSLTVNLLVPIGTIMAERLLYVPSIGFCLLAAIAIEAVAARTSRPFAVAAGICLALSAAYGLRTIERNPVWRDPRTFAEALVRDAPASARSHRELALVYAERGDNERARLELGTALALDPHDGVTLYDLGNIELGARRYDDAIAAYRRALDERPNDVDVMVNLGNAQSARGDEASAEMWFRRALVAGPGSTAAQVNLANALLRQGKLADAEEEYRRATVLAPEDPGVRFNHGISLEHLGRFAQAADEYRVALGKAPASAPVAVRLIVALIAAGRVDEARAEQARAEARFPGDPGVLQTRALLVRANEAR
jgi:protein O-mannosyl-transferase